jgi:uncharacterized protein YjbI with pentapeptide repeats
MMERVWTSFEHALEKTRPIASGLVGNLHKRRNSSAFDWDALLGQVALGQSCSASVIETKITNEMVSELLDAARTGRDRPILHEANFSGVVFEDSIDFTNTLFKGGAHFRRARFEGEARFSLAQFEGGASFAGATFDDRAIFESVKVGGRLGVGLGGSLNFESAVFNAYSSLGPLRANNVEFSGAHFAGHAVLSDLRVNFYLNFVATRFSEPVRHFNVGCRTLALNRVRFERGATLHLHGGEIILEGADLLDPTHIRGSQKTGQFLNIDKSLVVDGDGWRPRLGKTSDANVGNLVLSDVDLSQCVFRGAIGLDGLRLETPCPFDSPPRGVHMGKSFPFFWWWSKRMSLLEERQWRSRTSKWSGWADRQYESRRRRADKQDDGERDSQSEEAERLAKVYRALTNYLKRDRRC